LLGGFSQTSPAESFAGVVFKRLSAGQREWAKDFTLLIHGEGFDLIAGKVNTCFSRAFSQANPTVEMHGA
jgi:hypothetical protein